MIQSEMNKRMNWLFSHLWFALIWPEKAYDQSLLGDALWFFFAHVAQSHLCSILLPTLIICGCLWARKVFAPWIGFNDRLCALIYEVHDVAKHLVCSFNRHHLFSLMCSMFLILCLRKVSADEKFRPLLYKRVL